MILANFTGWGRADILDMDEEDFWADLHQIQAVNIQAAKTVTK